MKPVCEKPESASYQRLRNNGKPPKIALTAVMRKLIIYMNQLISRWPLSPTPKQLAFLFAELFLDNAKEKALATQPRCSSALSLRKRGK